MNYEQERWGKCMVSLWNMPDESLRNYTITQKIPNRLIFSEELGTCYGFETRFQGSANSETIETLLSEYEKQEFALAFP